VVAAGVTGWTTWVSSKQKQTSADLVSANKAVTDKYDMELVVRNLANRAKLVEDFLANRGSASDSANFLIKDGFGIYKWTYKLGGSEIVGVSASSPAALKEYADYLGTNYGKVQTEKVEWTPDSGWVGSFILTGKKKG
jgi:hypothetical protein